MLRGRDRSRGRKTRSASRPNLLPESNNFSTGYTSGANVTRTADVGLSPEGTMSADRIVCAGGDLTSGRTDRTIAISGGTASKSLTYSVVLVSGDGSDQTVRLKNTQGAVLDNFSPNLTVTSTPQRFVLTVTNGASAGNGAQIVGIVPATPTPASFNVIASGDKLEEGASFSAYP